MKKATIIVHNNYLDNVIKKIHENGLMEIIDISKEYSDSEKEENTEKIPSNPDIEICVTFEQRLSKLIDILKNIQLKKNGIKALLNPDLPEIISIEDRSLYEIYSYSEGILSEIENNILNQDQELQKINKNIELIDDQLNDLNYFKNFNFDISLLGLSEYTIIKAGKTLELEGLKADIKNIENAVLYSQQIGSKKKIEWTVIIAAYISEKDKIEKIIREKINELSFENLTGTPKELIKSLSYKKKELENKKKKIISDLRIYAKKHLSILLALREEIQLERVRKEITKNFSKTNSTVIIKGWILEKNENILKESISKISKDQVIYSFNTPSYNPDNPPTYLATPKWAKTFRTFVDLFAIPKHNELNPTIFIGIFFIIFFSLMLGDAGYGLVIFILSLFGYLKFGKYSQMIKNWSFLGLFLGLTTVIFGFLMNSFFGDFFPRFFNLQIPYIIDALTNPLIILGVALICGLIHLNLGIILGIFQAAHRRNYKLMLTHHFCWFPLQIGGGILAGNFILRWSINNTIFYISVILTIIGIILLFIDIGPLGLFHITGYVGDWLSYARLLALGLATSGMALAFNIISQLIGDMIPVMGVVITVILLFLLHTVNLAIQALGAGVHSLRLQYVEFFNRFYEGGGRKFSPFEIKRKFTKIEEK